SSARRAGICIIGTCVEPGTLAVATSSGSRQSRSRKSAAPRRAFASFGVRGDGFMPPRVRSRANSSQRRQVRAADRMRGEKITRLRARSLEQVEGGRLVGVEEDAHAVEAP